MLKLLVSPEDRRAARRARARHRRDRPRPHRAGRDGAAPSGLDFLVTAVFNYPTFAESYKVAALDADNRIKAMEGFGE